MRPTTFEKIVVLLQNQWLPQPADTMIIPSGHRLLLRLLSNIDQQIAAVQSQLSACIPYEEMELTDRHRNLQATRKYLENKLAQSQR
jgi:hypothetical protein